MKSREKIEYYNSKKHHNNLIHIFKTIFKRIYSIISVIATLSVFGALILFVIGRIGMVKMSDDDLIMREIVSQMPNNLEISSIEMVDIHGFDNESIIVFATNREYQDMDPVANQILIFDKVENSFLNQMYHFLGFGSKYKLTYSFSLQHNYFDDSSLLGYNIKLIDIVELTGDTSKELVVEIMSHPSGTSGSYEVAIISYSYNKHNYYVLGTYPGYYNEKIDYTDYNTSTPIENSFHLAPLRESNFYDKNEAFNLTWCSHDDYYFHYFKNKYQNYLVEAKMIWETGEAHISPHKYYILVYSARYDKKNDELSWTLNYCFKTEEYLTGDVKEYIERVLIDNNLGYIIK